jgi:hypothetical protein
LKDELVAVAFLTGSKGTREIKERRVTRGRGE